MFLEQLLCLQLSVILGAPLGSLGILPISDSCTVMNSLYLSYLCGFKWFKLIDSFLSNWLKERGPEWITQTNRIRSSIENFRWDASPGQHLGWHLENTLQRAQQAALRFLTHRHLETINKSYCKTLSLCSFNAQQLVTKTKSKNKIIDEFCCHDRRQNFLLIRGLYKLIEKLKSKIHIHLDFFVFACWIQFFLKSKLKCIHFGTPSFISWRTYHIGIWCTFYK